VFSAGSGDHGDFWSRVTLPVGAVKDSVESPESLLNVTLVSFLTVMRWFLPETCPSEFPVFGP